MDHAAVAKRIREAIFQKAEEDGRVIQDSVDAVIEEILRKELPAGMPYGGNGAHVMTFFGVDGRPLTATEEWR